MEVWTLDHPVHGFLELRQGFDAEFLAEDPDWPPPTSAGQDARPDAAAQTGTHSPGEATPEAGRHDEARGPSSGSGARKAHGERAPLGASYARRVRARLKNPPLRLQMRVDGEVTGRYPRTGVDEIRLVNRRTDEDGWSEFGSDAGSSQRRLKIQSSMLDDLLSVQLREGSSVVEFDPPAGSRGAKRQAAMESSSVKRILYPLMGGFGKAGLAVFFLLVFPLLARLLPDWDVDLPEVRLPQIHLPVLRLPEWDIDFPPLPGWLVTILEYDQVWKPVLIGLVIGVIAVRNHRKSQRQKAEWAAKKPAADERMQPEEADEEGVEEEASTPVGSAP
ncbi:hypothetical protein [Micrococcus sp. FDAARGOS_333]|uniref:hypothetical protein n=1 Tax=Micrococcus sp. FDAARGOS_333 TaxID=1930558 RepID=UPI000B4E0F66|nr:hypothetical protein [Micrococcus sp. FDAARGOS_333]PNL16813.1 hypothetical protein CEQ11_000295 [Micrococcus sp. FDAARGOS_333]